MPAPKSDPQREELYWLEAEFNGWWRYSSATTRELETLLNSICLYYRVEIPKFKVVRNKRWGNDGEYDPNNETITLNRSREGANAGVLCHEAAHYIVSCFYSHVEDHGKEFCAIYMHILDHFCFLPHKCFRMMAKSHRLKLARRYRPIAFIRCV